MKRKSKRPLKSVECRQGKDPLSRIFKIWLCWNFPGRRSSPRSRNQLPACPFCRGRGVRPSLEYAALSAFRKIESQAFKGLYSTLKLRCPIRLPIICSTRREPKSTNWNLSVTMSIHISGKSCNGLGTILKLKSSAGNYRRRGS